jgi:Uma2 family endonuclease
MTAQPKHKMTVDEFLTWSVDRPGRWELFDGVPVAMSPERVIHGDAKYRVARALDAAIEKAGVSCRFVLDSAAVRIDAQRSYQPDALVYCGAPVPGDALEVPNPVIVVEVLSPGNAMQELRDKLQGYFRVPSIWHYLIVDPDKRLIIHHARGDGDVIATRIVSDGVLGLDPPGIALAAADLLPTLRGVVGPALA